MRKSPAKNSTKATILLIDNDPLMLTLLAALLHNSGNECHCARDAEATLKAARTLPLDLVIADIDLLEDDGLELCRELKAETGMVDVPLLVLSGSQTPDLIQKVRDVGATYYLRKPYDPEVLLELVDKALWMPHLVHAQMQGERIKPSFHFAATTSSIQAGAHVS